MGIPLAALSVNPPQPGPNVLDQATRAFQLRQAMQQAPLQQQAAQQQVQTGALENQQRQQQLAQTQALNQAYTGAITQGDDGKPAIDWNAVTKGLATKGQGSLIPSVMKTSQEYQKTQNDLNEAQQKMQAVSIDHMGNIGAVIKASNYDPDMAMTFLEQGKAGAPPQEQARLMALEQQIRQNPALVKQYADQLIAQSPKQRELQSAEEQAAARKAVADTGTKKLEAEMPGGPLSPATLAGQEATARVTAESSPAAIRAAATKAGAEQSARNQADLAQFGGASGSSNLQGDAYLQTLPPMIRNQVQAISEGRIPLPSGFALTKPYWQNVMSAVEHYDPQFSTQRAELRKDYTVGKHSNEINAINTAGGHIGVLSDAIDALNNNQVQVLNKIANGLGAQVGQTPQTTFKTIVNRVGPELVKAYAGAGGGENERKMAEADFDPALSPEQLKSNVGVTARLLRSKISSLENQWNQNKAPATPDFQDRFITPEAKAAFDKLNPQGAGKLQYATDPSGQLHSAPIGQPLPKGWKAANAPTT